MHHNKLLATSTENNQNQKHCRNISKNVHNILHRRFFLAFIRNSPRQPNHDISKYYNLSPFRNRFTNKASKCNRKKRRMVKFLTIFFIIISLAQNCQARQISYSGGTTAMIMNDALLNSVHLHYSPSYKYSIGVKSENMHQQEISLNSLQVNYLAKRFNQKESQGNIYLRFNTGNAHKSSEDEAFATVGLMTDFETRKYFISYQNAYYKSQDDIISFFTQKARIGIAPYIANYGNIHTWLMLQVQHQSTLKGDQQTITTPLIRFFKGPYLTEIGVSSTKRVLFNFIARF